MIVPMREIVLLVWEDEKEEALSALRQWGALHIKEKEIPERSLLSLREEEKAAAQAINLIQGLPVSSQPKEKEDISAAARKIVS